MTRQTSSADQIRGLAANVMRAVEQGKLTLKQAVGLTDAEMNAVRDVAETYRRRGDLARAAGVYGLLISYDPFAAGYWKAMADLQRRQGQHVVAVACYEVLALLADREATSTYHEAQCLRQLGEEALSDGVTAHAVELAAARAERPGWVGAARRRLQRSEQ